MRGSLSVYPSSNHQSTQGQSNRTITSYINGSCLKIGVSGLWGKWNSKRNVIRLISLHWNDLDTDPPSPEPVIGRQEIRIFGPQPDFSTPPIHNQPFSLSLLALHSSAKYNIFVSPTITMSVSETLETPQTGKYEQPTGL